MALNVSTSSLIEMKTKTTDCDDMKNGAKPKTGNKKPRPARPG
jgi:hypothetical protein